MDNEYNMPVESQAVAEFQPPGEEYHAPLEGYGTRAQEIPKPASGEDVPRQKKSLTRMLLTAVLGVSMVTAAAMAAPAPPEIVPEPEIEQVSIAQRLLEVGDWVGDDGSAVRFDEGCGWFQNADGTATLFSWEHIIFDEKVSYEGFQTGVPITAGEDTVYIAERVFGDVVFADPADPDAGIQMESWCIGDERVVRYTPAETPTPAYEPPEEPDLFHLLPDTTWTMAYVSEANAGWDPESHDLFAGYEVRITGVDFEEDICTVHCADIYGGSKSFRYAWHYQERGFLPIVVLEPLEPVYYDLPDRRITSEAEREYAILTIEYSFENYHDITLWMPSHVIHDGPFVFYAPMLLPDDGFWNDFWDDPWAESQPTLDINTAELLLSVGTWVSEDDTVIAHFDVDGGWWKRTKNSDTYGLMSWWEENGQVAYTGFGTNMEVVEDSSPGNFNRSMVHRTVSGVVTVLESWPNPRIMLENPMGGESVIYVPTENVWESSPVYFYDQDIRTELPGSGWHVAPFSTMEADRAAAETAGAAFQSKYIWISSADFEGDTCTITFSDNLGGSASFGFTWEYNQGARGPEILLYPMEEIHYYLTDSTDNSRWEYTTTADHYVAFMSLCDDGPVLYLPNPFFNIHYGVSHEVMTRYR